MIRIEIPVEPHVQKYLIEQYGQWHVASKTRMIGLEIINALNKVYEKPDKMIDGHCSYIVYIPEYYSNTKGTTVSKNSLQHLGIVLGMMFTDDMCKHLDQQAKKGHKALPELKLWLQDHNITEDDIKVETLYKYYYRYCKTKRESKKKVA